MLIMLSTVRLAERGESSWLGLVGMAGEWDVDLS
jgi:hypothetical protein